MGKPAADRALGPSPIVPGASLGRRAAFPGGWRCATQPLQASDWRPKPRPGQRPCRQWSTRQILRISLLLLSLGSLLKRDVLMVPCVGTAISELHKIAMKEQFSAQVLFVAFKDICGHVLEKLPGKVKNKKYSDEYLVSVCFKKNEYMTPEEASAYCKVSLVVGVKYLRKQLELIEKSFEVVGDRALIEVSDLLYNYLHDFRPLIEYVVQSKDASYVFFRGSKYSGSRTQDLFRLSRVLSYTASISTNNPLQDSHRACCVASAFVLRQAMEVKFVRIVGVELIDKKYNAPKLWHGFHYDFVKENPHHFDFEAFDFFLLRHIYDWCSMMVHSAHLPLAWLLPMAHDFCEGLFNSGVCSESGYWHVHGAVRVKDIQEMQHAYAAFFSKNYEHGIFCVGFGATESVEVSKYLLKD
jgi:hypothetical protein